MIDSKKFFRSLFVGEAVLLAAAATFLTIRILFFTDYVGFAKFVIALVLFVQPFLIVEGLIKSRKR